MSTVVRVAALIALLVLAASCDRAAELIPGEEDGTAETGDTAAVAGAAPILVPSTVRVPGGAAQAEAIDAIPDIDLARSVVEILVFEDGAGGQELVRSGSGVVVDGEAGLILTSAYVVDPFNADGTSAYDRIGLGVNRTPQAGPTLELAASLVMLDRRTGLAVLRVDGPFDPDSTASVTPLHAPEFGDSDQMRRGEALRLFGHAGIPAGEELVSLEQVVTVTNASLTGFRGAADIEGRAWFKTDARLPFGSGGGPAFDASGRLVGISSQLAYDTGAPVAQIRPLALAVDLIEAARAGATSAPLVLQPPVPGTSATVSNDGIFVSQPAFAENAIDEDGESDLFDYALEFPTQLATLHYEFAAQGIPDGAQVQELWYLDGVVQDELSSTYTWSLGNFAIVTDRLASPNPRGNPDGTWLLEVWVNGELRASSIALIGVTLPAPTIDSWSFASSASTTPATGGPPFSTAGQLLAFFDYDNAATVTTLRWIVFRDGHVVYQSPSVPWEGGQSGTWWVGFVDEDGVGPGEWDFEIYFDNRVVSSGSTVVS